MIKIRKAADRGHFDFEWLKTWHTFSFGDYFDRRHMGFSVLRVINDDYILPSTGFPTHGHRDMEILTYIISGSLEHKDTLGNAIEITAGEVQRMTAGSGIRHSEANVNAKEQVHLLQIWILPEKDNLPPSYEQKNFAARLKTENIVCLASPDGQADSLKIFQDVKVFASKPTGAAKLAYDLPPGRKAWIQVVSGELIVNGTNASSGDGLAIEAELNIMIVNTVSSEFIIFDLP